MRRVCSIVSLIFVVFMVAGCNVDQLKATSRGINDAVEGAREQAIQLDERIEATAARIEAVQASLSEDDPEAALVLESLRRQITELADERVSVQEFIKEGVAKVNDINEQIQAAESGEDLLTLGLTIGGSLFGIPALGAIGALLRSRKQFGGLVGAVETAKIGSDAGTITLDKALLEASQKARGIDIAVAKARKSTG